MATGNKQSSLRMGVLARQAGRSMTMNREPHRELRKLRTELLLFT